MNRSATRTFICVDLFVIEQHLLYCEQVLSNKVCYFVNRSATRTFICGDLSAIKQRLLYCEQVRDTAKDYDKGIKQDETTRLQIVKVHVDLIGTVCRSETNTRATMTCETKVE